MSFRGMVEDIEEKICRTKVWISFKQIIMPKFMPGLFLLYIELFKCSY